MAVTLIGEVINNCNATTGFNQGGQTLDDDQIEGTPGSASIGLKVSTNPEEVYTTSLGPTAPYDFSTGGTENGYHIIMWLLAKTRVAVNETTPSQGLKIIVGNGTDRGQWYVTPAKFYKGGFVSKVIDTGRDFEAIAAGTWTLAGNPSQLSNITQVGGGMDPDGLSVMGNFNNFQIDIFTTGLGLEVSGGTAGSPNTFEEVREQDQDTNFWGWWSSSNGAFLGKGKLFIGATAGTSTFDDSAASVIFADELVAEDFYEINVRGTGTTCNFDLINISAANPENSRWDFNIDSSATFGDTNGVWSDSKNITLSSNAGMTGTTIINGQQLFQNGGSLDGITVLSNATGFTSYIFTTNPEDISNSTFEFNSGHAIEMTTGTTTSFNFSNNSFIGYGASGTTDAAIYNNTGTAITINITNGGDTPTIRNGAGASTTVINAFTLSLTNIVDDSEVRICEAGTNNELDGQESVTGGTFVYSYDYQAGTFVDIIIFKEDYVFNEPTGRISNFELTNANTTIPINQLFDRNYFNPT